MIVAIRISGQVGVKQEVKATLDRLRLKRKYACVLLQEKPEVLGMIEKVKDYIAFGSIDKDTLTELILKRGRLEGNKPVDAKKIPAAAIDGIFSGSKELNDLGLKPFFRLHPPRGGLKLSSKQAYPRGVLGNWKENITKLVNRML